MTAREDDLVALPWASVKRIPKSALGYGGGTMLLDEAGACIGMTTIFGKLGHISSAALDDALFAALSGAARLSALETERDEARRDQATCASTCDTLRDMLADVRDDYNALAAKLVAAEADARRCREVLRELTDDLEAELRGRYDRMLDHPAMKMRFDRDMDSVTRARALVSERQEGGE